MPEVRGSAGVRGPNNSLTSRDYSYLDPGREAQNDAYRRIFARHYTLEDYARQAAEGAGNTNYSGPSYNDPNFAQEIGTVQGRANLTPDGARGRQQVPMPDDILRVLMERLRGQGRR